MPVFAAKPRAHLCQCYTAIKTRFGAHPVSAGDGAEEVSSNQAGFYDERLMGTEYEPKQRSWTKVA